MAKAAELNGYPGPAHVLQLAGQLGLTEAQQRDVQAIFDRMHASAKLIGGELIAREQILDQLFAKGDITPDRLATATAAIAELQGRLRAVHLSAHLGTRTLLTARPPACATGLHMPFRAPSDGIDRVRYRSGPRQRRPRT